LLELLYASTLAGMAISNVRTGSIHEAGGALLEHRELSHAETLFVFFRDTYEEYAEHIKEREGGVLLRLKYGFGGLGLNSFEEVIRWWEDVYARNGITASISEGLKDLKMSGEELKECIFDRVFSDKVWIEKESPLPLDSSSIKRIIDNSLKRFGLF